MAGLGDKISSICSAAHPTLGVEVFSNQLKQNELKPQRFGHGDLPLPKVDLDNRRAWLERLSTILVNNFIPDQVPNLAKVFEQVQSLDQSNDSNQDLRFIGQQLGQIARASNLISGIGRFLNEWSYQLLTDLRGKFGSNDVYEAGYKPVIENNTSIRFRETV